MVFFWGGTGSAIKKRRTHFAVFHVPKGFLACPFHDGTSKRVCVCCIIMSQSS